MVDTSLIVTASHAREGEVPLEEVISQRIEPNSRLIDAAAIERTTGEGEVRNQEFVALLVYLSKDMPDSLTSRSSFMMRFLVSGDRLVVEEEEEE